MTGLPPLAIQNRDTASGLTVSSRLTNVLPGSSRGIMCAECSNHHDRDREAAHVAIVDAKKLRQQTAQRDSGSRQP